MHLLQSENDLNRIPLQQHKYTVRDAADQGLYRCTRCARAGTTTFDCMLEMWSKTLGEEIHRHKQGTGEGTECSSRQSGTQSSELEEQQVQHLDGAEKGSYQRLQPHF